LRWHRWGTKIRDRIHAEAGRDDRETLAMEADVFAEIIPPPAPTTTNAIAITIIARLRMYRDNPVFIALGERMEQLRDQHEPGILNRISFLSALREIAKGRGREPGHV
jgi:type I restriction enzyme R subunit